MRDNLWLTHSFAISDRFAASSYHDAHARYIVALSNEPVIVVFHRFIRVCKHFVGRHESDKRSHIEGIVSWLYSGDYSGIDE